MSRPSTSLQLVLAVAAAGAVSCSFIPIRDVRPRVVELAATETAPAEVIAAIRLKTEATHCAEASVVKVDPLTTDLLVADLAVTNRVYRFRSDGTPFLEYGEGVMNTSPLSDFAVLPNGDIWLFGDHAIHRYSSDGQLLSSQQVDYIAHNAVAGRAGVFVLMASPYPSHRTKAIIKYDMTGREMTTFHDLDTRLDKISYMPYNALALIDHTLYVTDLYDLGITAFSDKGRQMSRYAFDSYNSEAADYWAIPRRQLKRDHRTLVDRIHRFVNIQEMNGGLYLKEMNQHHGINRMDWLDVQNRVLYRYAISPDRIADPRRTGFVLHGIVGAQREHLIGSVPDPRIITRYGLAYAPLAGLGLTEESGDPVLCVLKLHRPGS